MESPSSNDRKPSNDDGNASCTSGGSDNDSSGEGDTQADILTAQEESTYAWLWRNQELADVSLEITFTTAHASSILCLEGTSAAAQTSDYSAGCTSTLMEQTTGAACDLDCSASEVIPDCVRTKQYVLHSQVIGSNSAVLRASLARAFSTTKRKRVSENGPKRWPLHAEVDSENADAVDAVLQYFYTHRLEDDLLGSELIGIMKVADLWQAQGLLAIATRKVLRLTADASEFPIAATYSLPDKLKALPVFFSVIAAAEASLLQTFNNARRIINTLPLLQQFLQLSHPALLALLRSPKLRTDSEESVVLLLSCWCCNPMGKACSSAQIAELNLAIRYGQLSVPYLTGLCVSLELPKLTDQQRVELWIFHNVPEDEREVWARQPRCNPPSWYLPHRTTLSAYESGVKLVLDVTEAELQLLVGGIGNEASDFSALSQAVYGAGFMWLLELAVDKGVMWCRLIAQGLATVEAKHKRLPLPCGVPRCISIYISSLSDTTGLELYQTDSQLVTSTGSGLRMTGCGGKYEEAAQLEWWSDQIGDGCVTFTANINLSQPCT